MRARINDLCRVLEIEFTDEDLLRQALTHRSAGKINNERLEYLGDSVLGFVVAHELFRRFPEASEGELSRLRAQLVKGVSLAEMAREIQLGDYLVLGPGEMKSGGERRDSILAGAFEAVIGAIYLQLGYEAINDVLSKLFGSRLGSLTLDLADKDNKTRLQEHMQSRQRPLPVYTLVRTEGKAHQQKFIVECKVVGMEPVQAAGTSRRLAEQCAASQVLELVEQECG